MYYYVHACKVIAYHIDVSDWSLVVTETLQTLSSLETNQPQRPAGVARRQATVSITNCSRRALIGNASRRAVQVLVIVNGPRINLFSILHAVLSNCVHENSSNSYIWETILKPAMLSRPLSCSNII